MPRVGVSGRARRDAVSHQLKKAYQAQLAQSGQLRSQTLPSGIQLIRTLAAMYMECCRLISPEWTSFVHSSSEISQELGQHVHFCTALFAFELENQEMFRSATVRLKPDKRTV